MEFRDAEVSDIVVVMDDCATGKIDDLVANLKAFGVSVSEIDEENCVIEGTVDAAKVKGVEKIPCVKYVRSVFTYVADYPVGDPRNLDETDREDEEIPQ